MRDTKYENGFSLAEAMIAVMVLGIAASGVLLPFSGGAAVQAEGARRTLSAKLAQDLLEKIINTPVDGIVSTYNYAEAQGEVKDASGVVFTDPAYAGFSRDVNCEYVYVPQQAGAGQPVFILVTVTVYYHGREVASLNRMLTE